MQDKIVWSKAPAVGRGLVWSKAPAVGRGLVWSKAPATRRGLGLIQLGCRENVRRILGLYSIPVMLRQLHVFHGMEESSVNKLLLTNALWAAGDKKPDTPQDVPTWKEWCWNSSPIKQVSLCFFPRPSKTKLMRLKLNKLTWCKLAFHFKCLGSLNSSTPCPYESRSSSRLSLSFLSQLTPTKPSASLISVHP